MRSPAAWILLVIVAALGTASDLWTKHWAFENVAREPVIIDRERVLAARHGLGAMTPPDKMRIIPGVLDFTRVLSPGAVSGIGARQRVFFVTLTGAAIGFALGVRPVDRPAGPTGPRGPGAAAGRWAGNLYDGWSTPAARLHPSPPGAAPLRDQVPNGSAEIWPWVSNVADAYLIVGIGLVLWHSWRGGREGHEAREASGAK